MLSGFRSWEHLVFKFPEGLSILCGSNGAGKSSIRLGVQYAIAGSVPRITKSELAKIDGKSAMSVELHMQSDAGESVVIRRTGSRTVISVAGVDQSVRENSYMANLRTAMAHTFLSPDIAAFVDVPDSKRKEMLYELIPEVAMLRSQCVPRMRDILKRYFTRRTNVINNIYSMEAVVAEQKRSTLIAKQNYDAEQRRIAALKSALDAELPYTEEEVIAFNKRIEEIDTDVSKLNKYMAEARIYVERATATNAIHVNAINMHNHLERELVAVRARIAAYDDIAKNTTTLSCRKCGGTLVCSQCGTQATTVAVDTSGLVGFQNQEKQLIIDLERQAAALAKAEVIKPEHIEQVRAEMRNAESSINYLGNERLTLRTKVTEYTSAVSNIEAVKSIQLDTSVAEAIRKNIEDTEELIKRSIVVIERKKRAVEVMERTERNMTVAVDAMNTVMPAVYFDHFLTRLSTYCNHLLEAISTMQLSMSASDSGISILVDGMNFNQLSSGERQRVRTATTLAFALLSRNSDTLFIDEVFDAYIDAEGIEELAIMLSTVMRDFYAKIIVVSHQPHLVASLKPDHVIIVEKNEDGDSYIVQGNYGEPK